MLVDIPPVEFLLVDIPLVDFSPVDIPPVDILLVDICAGGYLAGGYSAEVFLVGGYSAGGVLAGGYSAIFRYKSASVAQRFQNQNKMHDIKNPIWNKFFKPAISYLKFLRRLPFF